ncbi:very long chain fatty acid elongase 7-like [Lycorma delicatula]|uniref:very long chain fatty acid elongase 7-like n=1 Tax=Lycorma delicatula TaxID=130591 RepID=UPI003F516DD7
MASAMVQLIKWNYQQILNETSADPLVDSWFLMGSPWPVFGLVGFYLYFVLILGPKQMENRKPFDLTKVMILYNLYQVVFSSWLCVKLFRSDKAFDYLSKHYCHPLKGADNPINDELSEAAWYYFFSKMVELLDTIFFVLRKKQSQVTFLHVYHHANLAVSTWAYLKYVKGEQGVLIGFLNSVVHIIMYGYYLLAALGPSFQKYLWWKKHLTKLQLLQFLIMILYLVSLLLMDCELPKALTVYMTLNTTFFFVLFADFYRKAYIRSQLKLQKET